MERRANAIKAVVYVALPLLLVFVVPSSARFTAQATITTYSYLGCFKDTAHRTTRQHAVGGYSLAPIFEKHRSSHLHGEDCVGAQAGQQSWTGSFDQFVGFGDDATCDTPCESMPSQTCGGTWANSVYMAHENPSSVRAKKGSKLIVAVAVTTTSTTIDLNDLSPGQLLKSDNLNFLGQHDAGSHVYWYELDVKEDTSLFVSFYPLKGYVQHNPVLVYADSDPPAASSTYELIEDSVKIRYRLSIKFDEPVFFYTSTLTASNAVVADIQVGSSWQSQSTWTQGLVRVLTSEMGVLLDLTQTIDGQDVALDIELHDFHDNKQTTTFSFTYERTDQVNKVQRSTIQQLDPAGFALTGIVLDEETGKETDTTSAERSAHGPGSSVMVLMIALPIVFIFFALCLRYFVSKRGGMGSSFRIQLAPGNGTGRTMSPANTTTAVYGVGGHQMQEVRAPGQYQYPNQQPYYNTQGGVPPPHGGVQPWGTGPPAATYGAQPHYGADPAYSQAPPPSYGTTAPPPSYGTTAPPPSYGTTAPPPSYGAAQATSAYSGGPAPSYAEGPPPPGYNQSASAPPADDVHDPKKGHKLQL